MEGVKPSMHFPVATGGCRQIKLQETVDFHRILFPSMPQFIYSAGSHSDKSIKLIRRT